MAGVAPASTRRVSLFPLIRRSLRIAMPWACTRLLQELPQSPSLKKLPLSDLTAATSHIPPRKTATHKFSCVILALAPRPAASPRPLYSLPPVTAHQATLTAILHPQALTAALWPSAPPPLISSPTLPQAARFICATRAPAPQLSALLKPRLSPPTKPAYSPATIISFPRSVLPAVSSRFFPSLPQNIPRSPRATPTAVTARSSSVIPVLAPPPPVRPPSRVSHSFPATLIPCKANPPAQPSPATHKPSPYPAPPPPLFSPAPSPSMTESSWP